MTKTPLLNQKRIRILIQSINPSIKRIDKKFYVHLEARLRLTVEATLRLPRNKKSLTDWM